MPRVDITSDLLGGNGVPLPIQMPLAGRGVEEPPRELAGSLVICAECIPEIDKIDAVSHAGGFQLVAERNVFRLEEYPTLVDPRNRRCVNDEQPS